MNPGQILIFKNFAGRVPLKSQQQIGFIHAAAVVDDLNERFAAFFDYNSDVICTSVNRVFKQLLCHRRRPIHHFTCGYFVGEVIGKNFYFIVCNFFHSELKYTQQKPETKEIIWYYFLKRSAGCEAILKLQFRILKSITTRQRQTVQNQTYSVRLKVR